jgi:small-conductance mechanosensitive channel/CRP-like cAMP-binding protein
MERRQDGATVSSAMVASLGPPVALGLTVAALAVIRTRSASTRLLVEGLLLLALSGCFALWAVSPLPTNAEIARRPDDLWIRALAVVWWLVGARFVASLMVLVLGRGAHARQARLLSDLMAGAIYVTAALVVLNSVLGLELKGMLATSGLIAILVGLASQNTLADVFSGIAVGLEQPLHIGDRVSIGDYAEGVIVQMNWRSIHVQTDSDDIAMIPNSVVAKGLIINRSLPTPRRAASVEILMPASARPETLIELIGQATLLSPRLLPAPAPSVALKRLGIRSTTFVVSYSVAASGDIAPARAQVLRQAQRLFRHAGVGTDPAPSEGKLLSELALFESLTNDQISRLEAALIGHRLEAQGLLFAQGEVGASIYIVRSGVLEVFRQEAGVAQPHGRVGPGEYLGEISMMSGKPHPVSIRALTRCEVLELPRAALEGLLNDDGALGEAMEQSVQLGLALLDRDDAARNAQPLDAGGSLLSQIRQFLRRRLAYPEPT